MKWILIKRPNKRTMFYWNLCFLIFCSLGMQLFGEEQLSLVKIKECLREMEPTPPGQPSDPNEEVLTKAGATILTNLLTIISDRSDSDRIRGNAVLVISATMHRSCAETNNPVMKSGNVVPALVVCLGETNRNVAFLAAQALGAMGQCARDAVPHLIRASSGDNPSLRYCALEALGRIGPDAEAAIPHLEKALQDHDPDIRLIATQSLGRIRIRLKLAE